MPALDYDALPFCRGGAAARHAGLAHNPWRPPHRADVQAARPPGRCAPLVGAALQAEDVYDLGDRVDRSGQPPASARPRVVATRDCNAPDIDVRQNHTTDVFVVGGEHFRVRGKCDEVETKILDAARGSLMELVWLVEDESGQSLGLNPEHVVAIRSSSA